MSYRSDAPPTGFEPVHLPPEGSALSPELRGHLGKAISHNSCQDALVSEKREERAYFATGCFWGAERRFWKLPGVLATSVGYMGGTRSNPTYEQVCTGTTNHAETVEVKYDPEQIAYERLLEEFWTMHDPTSLNKQGGDIGTQYRSAIFTTSKDQMISAVNTREIYNDVLKSQGFGEIVTEIQEAAPHTYWPAEEYHQRYLEKNPNGYDCHSTTGVPFPRVRG